MAEQRIQKVLADQGICSRREAERLIAAGKVKVNGHPVGLGDKMDPDFDKVSIDGKTQRIVKLEISGTPEDDLLGDVASYIEGLRFGSSELGLVRLDDADFQTKMTALSSEFDDLRNELILVRQRGMNGRLVKPLDAKKLAKSIREAVQNQQ